MTASEHAVIILGINAYHGDASACLVIDGVLVAAVEEERPRRIKHWAGFPSEAIGQCLSQAGVTLPDVDHVAVGRSPTANLLGKLAYVVRNRPPVSLIRDRTSNLGRIRDVAETLCSSLEVDRGAIGAKIHYVEHHRAHLASSYHLSPFDEAACVSIDGFGDFVSTMWAIGSGARIRVLRKLLFPHSLGVFYTAGTQFLGFGRFGDEYKVMGLAPYGEPEFASALRRLISLDDHGSFRLDTRCFRHTRHVVDTRWDGCAPEVAPYFSDLWCRMFGPARGADEPITDRHRNFARSMQDVSEEVYLHALNHAAELSESENLCLAGGCAFNSVVNGKILERTRFRRLHIHPAAGDAGTAVGAAYTVWHEKLGRCERHRLDHAFLGPGFSDQVVRGAIERAGLPFEWLEDREALVRAAVESLKAGLVVGWFHGRAEWGPRALGNRSILADPRRPEMKETLNDRIKRREEFRPFAPAVLEERMGELFENPHPAPFMNQVYRVRASVRELLPAVTHVDGSGRLQTVSRSANPLFHRLIEAFAERTGLPAVLNTSFNENEPIVHTPEEAIACFLRTGMDVLVIGPAVLRKPGAGGG